MNFLNQKTCEIKTSSILSIKTAKSIVKIARRIFSVTLTVTGLESLLYQIKCDNLWFVVDKNIG